MQSTPPRTPAGGVVEIPANGTLSTYLCGPINLNNNINLQIDNGAMLQMLPMTATNSGSVVIPGWPNASTAFINGAGLSDVEISGPGTIDGQGTNWWFPKAATRPNFINFSGCTRVLIQNVTLQNPPTFHMMLKGNNVGLTIQNVIVNTPFSSPNTDGMDLASTNVLIRNCYISDGDDNIEIGGSSAPAADITISNCVFGTGHGVSIGSLTQGGVSGLTVSNCSWYGTEYGIKMKTDRDRGGLIQNLKYCDLVMTNVNIPFAFYEYYNSMGSPTKNITNAPAGVAADVAQPITSTTPIFRNVTISNLTAVGNTGIQGPGNIAGIIFGVPEMPITNVTLCNVNIQGRGHDGTICLYNVRDIRIIDSNLTAPLTGTNVLTIYNAQFVITNSSPNANTITITGLGSPSNSVLALFNGQAETGLPVFGPNPTLTLGSSILTVSNGLNLGSASVLNFALGTNNTEIVVAGDLSLDGTVNISDGGGFAERTFTLLQYSGNLTTNGTPRHPEYRHGAQYQSALSNRHQFQWLRQPDSARHYARRLYRQSDRRVCAHGRDLQRYVVWPYHQPILGFRRRNDDKFRGSGIQSHLQFYRYLYGRIDRQRDRPREFQCPDRSDCRVSPVQFVRDKCQLYRRGRQRHGDRDTVDQCCQLDRRQ